MRWALLLNRVNLYLAAGIIVIFTLCINEIAIYFGQAQDRLSASYDQALTPQDMVFRTQELCQQRTRYICDYQSCDYKPGDPNFDTECGKNFRTGWKAGTRSIPSTYQNIDTMTFSLNQDAGPKIYELNADNNTIAFGESGRLTAIRDVDANDITQIINRMIIVSLFSKLNTGVPAGNPTEAVDELRVSAHPTTTDEFDHASANIVYNTGWCVDSACPQEMRDVQSQIELLWNSATPHKK